MTKKELIHRICRDCASPLLKRISGGLPQVGLKRHKGRRNGRRKAIMRKAG